MKQPLELWLAETAAEQAWSQATVILHLCDFIQKLDQEGQLMAYLDDCIREEDERILREDAQAEAMEMFEDNYPDDDPNPYAGDWSEL